VVRSRLPSSRGAARDDSGTIALGGGGESHGGHGGGTVAAKEPETNDTRMAATPASRRWRWRRTREWQATRRARFGVCVGPDCAPLASAKVPPTMHRMIRTGACLVRAAGVCCQMQPSHTVLQPHACRTHRSSIQSIARDKGGVLAPRSIPSSSAQCARSPQELRRPRDHSSHELPT
jgi:hypothetical protein